MSWFSSNLLHFKAADRKCMLVKSRYSSELLDFFKKTLDINKALLRLVLHHRAETTLTSQKDSRDGDSKVLP